MTDAVETQDELSVLKERATMLGIDFHPSIGLAKLREKVNAAVAGEEDAKPDAPEAEEKAETEGQKRLRAMNDALKLVRIRVTCMNPAKAEWPGEIFTVANSLVGSVKKYVPFNVDDGWHVPNILLQMLKERQCQIFVNGKTKHGVTVRQGKLIREFAIEVLPDLTEAELKDLAQRQVMAGGTD